MATTPKPRHGFQRRGAAAIGPGAELQQPRAFLDNASPLIGTSTDRWVGIWSARVLFGIGVCYAVTVVAGFISLGNLRDPLQDPYLAIAEVLIILMAPVMVLLMAATHICAPPGTRVYSMTALGWMVAAAALHRHCSPGGTDGSPAARPEHG